MENCILCTNIIGAGKPRLRATVMDTEGVGDILMCRPCVERANSMSRIELVDLMKMVLLAAEYTLPKDEEWKLMTAAHDDERHFPLPKDSP